MLAPSLQLFVTDPKNHYFKDLLVEINKIHPEIHKNINFDQKIFKYDKNLSQKEMGISDGETIGMIDVDDDEYAD